jgi:hypothetical protein
VRKHVPTLAHLEALLCIRRHADQRWTVRAVADHLGIPRPAAEVTLIDLCSTGLLSVNVGTSLSYQFNPVTPALATGVEDFVSAFRRHRARVCDLVMACGPHTAGHCSNACRPRRRKNGGANSG